MPYFVYVVECADRTYYTGSTNDIGKRIAAHNAGKTGAKYTRGRLPVRLLYTEKCVDKSGALKREAVIKRMRRADKLVLLGSG
jgi:putative endonuclease